MTNPPNNGVPPPSPTEIEPLRAGMIEDGVRRINAWRRSRKRQQNGQAAALRSTCRTFFGALPF
jgi:hypothetical protein